MATIRKPFQGTWNIIKFNWHFYACTLPIALIISLVGNYLPTPLQWLAHLTSAGILFTIALSLLASWYIYDFSDLYSFNWLKPVNLPKPKQIVNIHAGFDETSELLHQKYPSAHLTVLDFYNPQKHTEVSIKRARKAYSPYPDTLAVNTQQLPLATNSVDIIFVLLSAHEIRDQQERSTFFRELHRTLKPSGRVIVTEHLRDLPNFLVYNIGFLHFISKKAWISTFDLGTFEIGAEIKITPFLSSFILKKNETTS